jgi:hypothetical protein
MNRPLEQATVGYGLVEMVQPSLTSTVVFVAIVGVVGLAFLGCVAHAYRGAGRRVLVLSAVAYSAILALSYGLAASGALTALAGQPLAFGYLVGANSFALLAALSPFGRRLAAATPYWALALVHGFRLPLELVLHRWWQEGVLPVQMTYVGDNWDIVTGVLALICGLLLRRASTAASRWLAAAFSVVGLGLLVRVMSIAARSLPGPMRGYPEDPAVLLAFHAPYTWIVPGCVSAALFFHVVLIRKLLSKPLAADTTGSR